MPEHIIIDGNNLLYNMHAHAPLPAVGRETLVKILERWVREHGIVVTLVFDGPVPDGGLAHQMTSSYMTVKFSAPATADDIIVSMIEQAGLPAMLRVVSSDTAIQHAARHRRCQTTDAVAFIAELFPPEQASPTPPTSTQPAEKPEIVSPNETDKWLDVFGIDRDDEDEPFNGHDAMTQ
jgi:predicted RNA-binding protein with PIN domain